ncbi:MAG: hypothetical protein U9O66_00465 [Patescibacteria group bacterium]|nr:hypothetical protein [Patescibacteria group bacterium]
MKDAFVKTLNSLKQTIPIIVGVLFLLGFVIAVIPKTFYITIFSGNKFADLFFGALIGSVSGGNPITSYILGGELLNQGVSLLAVTAFILAWVTVGLIQLPAESLMLGKRFAIIRNIASFLTAIIIAILTVITLSII